MPSPDYGPFRGRMDEGDFLRAVANDDQAAGGFLFQSASCVPIRNQLYFMSLPASIFGNRWLNYDVKSKSTLNIPPGSLSLPRIHFLCVIVPELIQICDELIRHPKS